MSTDTNISGNKPLTILPETRHLVLCEGKDDQSFLSCYLKSGMFSQLDLKTIQVMQVEGVNNFRNRVRVLVNAEGFSHLRSLLIIRDADTDIRSAQDHVKGVFSSAGLPVPPSEHQWNDNGTIQTGFLLMPTCDIESQEGILEDLCWEIFSEKSGPFIHEDVKSFINSLESSAKRTFNHKSKSLLHTYFSVTDNLISASIELASVAGAFDWTSAKLHPLSDFINSMYSASGKAS